MSRNTYYIDGDQEQWNVHEINKQGNTSSNPKLTKARQSRRIPMFHIFLKCQIIMQLLQNAAELYIYNITSPSRENKCSQTFI